MGAYTIGLIGNPNCGKTTLFNALTGSHQKVGNWPGVTVDRKSGWFELGNDRVEVVDLPGTYSLDPISSASLDEAIARNYVISGEADLIVNIVDASNLERNLYLSVQLMEMRVPLIVAVNMLDLAETAGIHVDCEELSARLGCPVLPLVAAKGQGVDALKKKIIEVCEGNHRHGVEIVYAPVIETALQTIEPLVESTAKTHHLDPRWLGLKVLEGDTKALALVDVSARQEARRQQLLIEAHTEEEADVIIADARYTFIHEVVGEVATRQGKVNRSLTDRIDRVVLNRFFGIPIFLGVMYSLFVLSFNGGNIFIDFFNGVAHALFVSGVGHLLESWHSPKWLVMLLAESVGGSLVLISTFIAPVGMTFLFLSILEDSGYMARAAFVMDRFMRRIGLPGKAFVPMIVGFGCNVPAVMATRTLEDRRERLVSALMQPFMSCSARLVIYMAFVSVFFRDFGGQLVFALYVLGIVAAIGTAFLLKRTALKGEATPFVMEMPAYHVPTLRGMVRSTWDRLSVFLLRVGKVIIIASIVVNILASFTLAGKPVGEERIGDSTLAVIGKTLTPAFHPMGITDENWPATVGLLSGVVVKEIVIGTLDGIYTRMDAGAKSTLTQAPSFDLWRDIAAAVATIPENARAFSASLLDPLGLSALVRMDHATLSEVAQQQDVSTTMLSRMGSLFTVPAAIAYLIFVLLYLPCVNTLAAIWRETGSRQWTMFSVIWGLELAYSLSVLFYQFATFPQHPIQSLLWLAGILILFTLTVWYLRRLGTKEETGYKPVEAA